MVALRHIKATIVPRKSELDKRGAAHWVPDYDNAKPARVGITNYRNQRAEVRGDVEIETYYARLPWKFQNVGPGARLIWDGTEWDISDPPALRATRTHSVRHVTVVIRRRPYRTEEGRT